MIAPIVRGRKASPFYLLSTAGLVGAFLAVVWFSVRADDTPLTVRSPDDLLWESESVLSVSSQHTQFMTVTVHLPLVMNGFPPPPPAFGVQMGAITDPQGLAQAVDAGVYWVRFNAFNWDQIEPVRTEPPTYHWDLVDQISLSSAAANDMEVIAVIRFTPDWAQKVSGSYCGPIKADALDEFAQFLQTLVSRYSVAPYSVRYWELGNEPDVDPMLVEEHSGFGCWGDENDEYYGGGYYAEMLRWAYPAIKAADPHAQVLIGGLLLDCDPRVPASCSGPHGDMPLKFLEGILRNGGGENVDVMSFHAYSFYDSDLGLGHMGNSGWPGSVTVVPEKTGFLREVLTEYGCEDKRLMNTESALLCSEPTDECLETQAMYVPRVYAEALALGLEGQTYYAMTNDGWHHTGLLRPDLTPKPVYHAYKTAAFFLSHARYQGEIAGYPASVEGYSFLLRYGNGFVDVIWSTDGTAQNVTLPVGASAYDRYGDLIAASGTIQVDHSPVYVVRP
jgi:hypothetical protein